MTGKPLSNITVHRYFKWKRQMVNIFFYTFWEIVLWLMQRFIF